MSLHVVSLFSGIGGIDIAFERAGARTVLFCESDKHARTVLARHWPDTPIRPDVRELTADDLRNAGARPDNTIVCAGFPCQDLSIAGGRRGMGEGTRSGLFWEIIRLLADFPARWVVLENVPGLLSSHGGRDMGAVLGALADLGYGYAWRVLDAQYAGVPQRRRRVVIVGHLGAPWSAPAEVLLEPYGGSGHLAAGVAARQGVAGPASRGIVGTLQAHHGRLDADSAGAGHLIPVVTPLAVRGRDGGSQIEVGPEGGPYNTLRAGDGGSSRQSLVAITTLGDHTHALTAEGHDASEDGTGRGTPIIATHTEVRRLTPLETERLQGHPDNWTKVAARPDGTTYEQSDSQRYKQMGNGVAVPVFEWVARRVVAEHQRLTQAGAA